MNRRTGKQAHEARAGLYRSYLLRIWRTPEDESGCCRASLEDPQSCERVGFASLEELFVFLLRQAEGRAFPVSDSCIAGRIDPEGQGRNVLR